MQKRQETKTVEDFDAKHSTESDQEPAPMGMAQRIFFALRRN